MHVKTKEGNSYCNNYFKISIKNIMCMSQPLKLQLLLANGKVYSACQA